MLHFHSLLGRLFHKMLVIPEGVQIFTNQYQYTRPLVASWIANHAKVSAIATVPAEPLDEYRDNLNLTIHEQLELFNPPARFHLGFSAYPFLINPDAPEKEQVQPLYVKDRCQFFKCSEGKPDREVALHLLGLEQMLQATLPGGYFGAVLPKKWVGREMKYLRWWNDNAALVARIKLPADAVQWEWAKDGNSGIINCPGDWEVQIWNRPTQVEGSRSKTIKQLDYAKYRYTPFVFPLESMSATDISGLVDAFQVHEWYHTSITHWHAALRSLHSDRDWGTYRIAPYGVSDPRETYFFQPKPEFTTGLRIVKSVEDIKKLRHAVHVKPGRTIKLSCYNAPAQGALLDLRCNNGLMVDDKKKFRSDNEVVFKYDHMLHFMTFSDVREKLLSELENQGLIPCMTEAEHRKMLKKERWLSIQLTPNERYIPASKAASQSEGLQSGEEADWELAYEDIGMESSFPEIMDMWRKRAKAMNMHRQTFEFQFEDLPYYSKAGLANTSVMGLGKTRTTLFGQLLRCSQRILIVCPAKLIGVWQNEIEETIGTYAAFQKRDWQGKIIDASYQVIQWASDLRPDKLKRFNLISYDKLKTIARDGKFFKCPKCGTISYTAKGGEHQVCTTGTDEPNYDPKYCSNRVKIWKKLCKGDPDDPRTRRRKFRVAADGDGNPIIQEGGGYIRVHWTTGRHIDPVTKEESYFPLESTCVIDERPTRPMPVAMEAQEHVFKKMHKTVVGYERDLDTGAKVPNYKMVERSPHLRWTFAKLTRNRFSHIVLDEALYIMNADSQRTQAINVLNGRNRVILTGTPIKNRPENILGLLNWCFQRDVFPSYRPYDPQGLSRFLGKYRTEVYVGGVQMPDGSIAGGIAKPVPKINNPELFQAEIAPLQRRHVRNEPKVLKNIPRKVLVEHNEIIDMDPEHRAYYEKWLKEFAEWWQKMKEEEEGRSVTAGDLLAKLTYLINASTIPHYMLENILSDSSGNKKKVDLTAREWAKKIGPYTSKRPTAKMRHAWKMIREAVANNDKVLVASWRRANLKLGQSWSEKNGLASMIVDGTVPLEINPKTGRSKRQTMVDEFRSLDYHVMWAGLEALAEGLNIPEANHGIVMDCGWAPNIPRQFIGRMIRPAQTKVIHATYLMHRGTIDDYMFMLSYLKGRSADEAIDYMEFDDFSTDMIPDIHQYADCIVDGTEEIMKAKMWLAVDHLKKQDREEGDEE